MSQYIRNSSLLLRSVLARSLAPAALAAGLLAGCGVPPDEAASLAPLATKTSALAARADKDTNRPAPSPLVPGTYHFSGCTAYTGSYITDRYGTSYIPASTDGYYEWISDRTDITVTTIHADDTLDVEIGGAAGTLTDSPWSGYQGVLGAPPLQVDVTMYYPSSHLKTTIHYTKPKKTYPDGSWSQETTLSEFQSGRLCGLGRR